MLGIELTSAAYLDRLRGEIARIDPARLVEWSELMHGAWQRESQVLIIGNGGSATTASHFAEDLGKSTIPDGRHRDAGLTRLKVLSLTDNVGWITAAANDIGYDQVFVQQLMNYGRAGDLLIAISGSGNSENVIQAVQWGRQNGLVTFGLTGYDGGRLKQIAAHGLHVALHDMGMVESIHLCLFHWVLNDLFARIHQVGRHSAAAPKTMAT